MHLKAQLKCILFGSFRNSLYLLQIEKNKKINKNNNRLCQIAK